MTELPLENYQLSYTVDVKFVFMTALRDFHLCEISMLDIERL